MTRTEVSSRGVFRPRVVTSAVLHDSDTVVVELRGEHDRSTMPAVAAALASAVASRQTNLVVDMSEVQFMNAATVRVLTAAQGFLARQSRTFAVRSPSRCARRILDLCGATDLYGHQDT